MSIVLPIKVSDGRGTRKGFGNFRHFACIQELSRGNFMSETRTTAAVVVRTAPERTWLVGTLDLTLGLVRRLGAWAGDTAQQFGALLAALMGPAVFSVYAFAFWSLTANLGWTDTFLFQTGPLSNWLVWMSFAFLITLAASILRRHTRTEI